MPARVHAMLPRRQQGGLAPPREPAHAKHEVVEHDKLEDVAIHRCLCLHPAERELLQRARLKRR